MSKHTKGPWKAWDIVVRVDDKSKGARVAVADESQDAARIVECFNACVGIENPKEHLVFAIAALKYYAFKDVEQGVAEKQQIASHALKYLGVK